MSLDAEPPEYVTVATSPPEVVKEVVEPKKPSRQAEEQAAALRARSRPMAQRSLLSPEREGAQAGLSTKLGGMG